MVIKILAILAVVIGITMMAYTGFNFTTTEEVVDLGNLQINRHHSHYIQWPPIAGLILMIGGIIALLVTRKTPAKT